MKGIITPLYLLAVLTCQGADQELSMVAKPMRAGASPARTLSHCTCARQLGRPRGGRQGQPRVEITTQACGNDAGLGQAMKSIHSSGSSPVVVTGVRNSPAIARQVYSDGARLRPGQKANPQIKAQINKVRGQAHVHLGQSQRQIQVKHISGPD